MNCKAVVFDMDGLILDTELIEHRSLEILLKEYGKEPKPHPNGLVHRVGVAGPLYYKDFIDRYGIEEDFEILRKKKRLFFDQIILTEEITAFPGLLDLLNLLKREKFMIALASNRNEETINLILKKLDIKYFFDVIVGPSDNRKHKPEPDIYLHTARELKVLPKECVVLEDSEPGIAAAKSAGMKVIAIPNIYTIESGGFTKADRIVASLKEVDIALIKSL